MIPGDNMQSRFKLVRTCGLLLLLATVLPAQMLRLSEQRPQPTILWDDDTLVVIEKFGAGIRLGDLNTGTYREVGIPVRTLGVSFRKGAISCVRMERNQFLYERLGSSGEWESSEIEVGKDSRQRGFPTHLYETDKPDILFAINTETGFIKGDEASCCAWWRRGADGKIRMEDLIPIEWEGPLFQPILEGGVPKYGVLNSFRPGAIPLMDVPIRVPGAFVVVSWKAGILWVIKDGAPSPTRIIELVSMDREFLLGKRPFPSVVLGIQPMRNGNLIVAHRSARAIAETYKHYQTEPSGENPRKMDYEFSEAEKHIATVAYPEIEWKELDPVGGTHNPPSDFLLGNAPSMLKSNQEAHRFIFGFDVKERLVFPWRPPEVTTTLGKKSQEKKDQPQSGVPQAGSAPSQHRASPPTPQQVNEKTHTSIISSDKKKPPEPQN